MSAFSPLPSTPPQPVPPPSPTSTPPWFCPCVLYSSSYRPLSPLSPPHSPVAIVTMFLISMSLVIFCLLFSSVDYVPVKGEIIWYFSLTAWLISLSGIFIFRSLHAIAFDLFLPQWWPLSSRAPDTEPRSSLTRCNAKLRQSTKWLHLKLFWSLLLLKFGLNIKSDSKELFISRDLTGTSLTCWNGCSS